MTDRELLELATKAAGNEVWTDIDGNLCTAMNYLIEKPWNPLIDDGDALRLAVALRFTVKIEDHEIEVFNWEGCIVSIAMFDGDDYDAATRRAIVRAAAELQRQKENK